MTSREEVKKSQTIEARARNINPNVPCTECGSQSTEDSQADIVILLKKVKKEILEELGLSTTTGNLACELLNKTDWRIKTSTQALCFSEIYQLSLLKDLVPGDFVHTMGDACVYNTHFRSLHEQL